MKNIFLILSALFVLFGASNKVLADEERLAILDFKSIMAPPEMGEAVAEILRTELAEISGYTIIERGMLASILEEQSLQLTGAIDVKTAVEIGKLLEARLVILGSIIKTGKVYTINSRFIEIETGVIRKGLNIKGKGEDKIPELVHKLALNIMEATKKTAPFILSFEDPNQAPTQWEDAYEDGTAICELSDKHATKGSHSLMVKFKRRKSDNYPGIRSRKFPTDWSLYKTFTADIYFAAEKDRKESFGIRIDDQKSSNFKNRFHHDTVLVPGKNTISFELEKVDSVLNTTAIRTVYFFFDEPKEDITLYIDNVRLE